MKNYKVEALIKFTDKEEDTKRNVGDQFEVTKERYEFLKKNNAVKLIEIVEEKEVALDETINEVVDEVVEEIVKKKRKKSKK